jgi:hypothetical protein
MVKFAEECGEDLPFSRGPSPSLPLPSTARLCKILPTSSQHLLISLLLVAGLLLVATFGGCMRLDGWLLVFQCFQLRQYRQEPRYLPKSA